MDERMRNPTMERLLLRPEEAAESLGLSRSLLYQLMASGEIAHVKIGTARRIPAAELERYVAGLVAGAVAK